MPSSKDRDHPEKSKNSTLSRASDKLRSHAAVLDYLKQHEDRFIATLTRYVRFPSVSAQAGPRRGSRRLRGNGCGSTVKASGWNHRCARRREPDLVARPGVIRVRPGRIYWFTGIYDVQPPEPFGLWKETRPSRRASLAGKMFGPRRERQQGAKPGPISARWRRISRRGTELPATSRLSSRARRRWGAINLEAFCRPTARNCAAMGWSSRTPECPAKGIPALTCSLRGIVSLEIKLHGPSRDLHSGLFGGSVGQPGHGPGAAARADTR